MSKVLILDNSPAFTGAFKSIFQVTQELSSKIEFIYVIPKGSKNKRPLENFGIKVIELPFIEIAKNLSILCYLPQLLINTLRINSIIKKQKIEIVHVNDLYNMLGVSAKMFNSKIKLVYHVRLLPNSYTRILYSVWKKLIERFADKVICVSGSVARNFNKKKSTIIYDAIALAEVRKNKEKTSMKNVSTILYLSNYISGKGHKQAIEAFYNALPNVGNTKLVCFGGTLAKGKNERFKEELIQYSNDIGLAENIVFNDFIKFPEEEIVIADLMLNFSESESFSMTTLEALAYGTPIIATACGGPSEIIEHGHSGILVPVNDIKAMASGIEKLMNNPELRLQFSQNGKRRVHEKFLFKRQTQLLMDIYNKLIFR